MFSSVLFFHIVSCPLEAAVLFFIYHVHNNIRIPVSVASGSFPHPSFFPVSRTFIPTPFIILLYIKKLYCSLVSYIQIKNRIPFSFTSTFFRGSISFQHLLFQHLFPTSHYLTGNFIIPLYVGYLNSIFIFPPFLFSISYLSVYIYLSSIFVFPASLIPELLSFQHLFNISLPFQRISCPASLYFQHLSFQHVRTPFQHLFLSSIRNLYLHPLHYLPLTLAL